PAFVTKQQIELTENLQPPIRTRGMFGLGSDRMFEKIDAKVWSPTGAQNATETFSIAPASTGLELEGG
ncbi:hypothetical protein, partial [Mesorhizobium sp. M4B.F.Ca.ET.089.01.1.1]|uniref:hypothetical protein n=1 Tax=Mesorhizobium sp. M4B.F.Ca.ET.089.01.1.1 TaxID=2496662 RepID=UPI001AEC7E59